METRSSLRAAQPILLGLALLIGAGFLLGSAPASAQGVYGSGLFELGDGQPPAGMPGLADIAGDPAQAGPDWADLFGPDGKPVDDFPYDANGNPLGDGVPDYRQVWGGDGVAFVADDVSLGVAQETSARCDKGVRRATAAADQDLGFAYFYRTHDGQGRGVLYAGFERLGDGFGTLELEFNQAHFDLGHGGFGVDAPWSIEGTRTPGDLEVTIDFGPLASSATLSTWDGQGWTAVAALAGEGCDGAESFCLIGNASEIEAGPWTAAAGTQTIPAGRFFELGVRLPGAAGAGFVTVQLRTPQDVAFGYFGEN